MSTCLFASDLHGRTDCYEELFRAIAKERPAGVFLGGDLMPSGFGIAFAEQNPDLGFMDDFLVRRMEDLRDSLGGDYPRVFLILGNDDLRAEESALIEAAERGLWEYLHNRRIEFGEYVVYGYANVPPTPFRLKDWERYDVSRGVDPGCVSPEKGMRSVAVPPNEIRYSTIKTDLEELTGDDDLDRAIFLFHTPPYNCKLDRAALDGRMIDHVPLDVHIGSIAVQRFIESRQPRITLHGHVHESARLTGAWSEQFGRTWSYTAAHDGPELALVRFDPDFPEKATRQLL